MTRQIKFRIWTGSMMEDWTHVKDWESLGFYLMCGDGYVPMQFTGLHDKNGKEIYEGDVVDCNRYVSFESHIVIIEDIRQLSDMLLGSNLNFRTIIGNIYENPELVVNNVNQVQ